MVSRALASLLLVASRARGRLRRGEHHARLGRPFRGRPADVVPGGVTSARTDPGPDGHGTAGDHGRPLAVAHALAHARPTPTAPTPTAPSPGADTPTADTFWGFVEHGVRDAARLEVEIAGPNAGTLRYEADASATVIEGVVGFVCLGGRAYDGQSGFTAIPGSWTCGAAALVAGFRTIGQPLDAWNATLPSDDARRETVTVRGNTWTWSYRATSPYYGGRVTAVVTLDRTTLRVTAARREDPTGVTTYTFRYRASFPAIVVPR